MPVKNKVDVESTLKEKIEYLKLSDISKALDKVNNLNFRVLRGIDEKKYTQYRYINIKDIDILLTTANRSDSLKERYEKARPLFMFFDPDNKENIVKNTAFIEMVKKVEISDVEKIVKEQELLSKTIPFRVKFEGNYLWQIYYSEHAKRYFMLTSIDDTDYSTFFYLLKKKIENKKDEKIFVPVSYVEYSGEILKRVELRDLENYLWLFTKDYSSIYEVTDKKRNLSLHVSGETGIYGKVKTLYKMVFKDTKEALKFYKLSKALFILQTELPHYYDFKTNVDSDGVLKLYLDNAKIDYEDLPEFVLEQYLKSISMKQKVKEDLEGLNVKLDNLKREAAVLENEYITKEKQISTYLECKKSFFGKVKYYFKFGKKVEKVKENKEEFEEEINTNKKNKKEEFKLEDRNYTLDELVVSFKELEILENNQKNTIMDINALKLKNKNLKKKIENATLYINEINKHKRSIFEFWKYSNKDEVAALEEGEQEELNVKKIEKTFNYDDDFERFGEAIDKAQRMNLTDSELDSCFIASTNVLEIINKTYKKQAESQDYSEAIKNLKLEKDSDDEDDFDVFGKLSSERSKERSLGNKTHRETPRDKFKILDVRKGVKGLELKKTISVVIKDLKKALSKNTLQEDIYAYKASTVELELDEFQTFSLNEETEVNQCLKQNRLKRRIYLYRIKLNKGTSFVALSNIIYYNNKNMTLPVGMNVSNKILVDLSSLDIKAVNEKSVTKVYMDNNKNDFAKVLIKPIEITEYDSKMKEVNE